jgi:hypothetical protein
MAGYANAVNCTSNGVVGFLNGVFTGTEMTANELVIGGSTFDTLSQIASTNNGVLISGTTGIPSWLANGTTGQILTATTGNPPSWASPSSSGIVTSVSTSNSTPQFVNTSGAYNINFQLTNLVLGSALPSLTSGTLNVGVGSNALTALTSGAANTAFGTSAGTALTTGGANSLCGYQAGLALTSGSNNIAIGEQSLLTGVSVQNNIAIGVSALRLTTSNANTCVGSSAGANLASNGQMAAFGYNSLNAATGISNTAFGSESLANVTTGANNIGIGFNAGSAYGGAESSNIVIGNGGTVSESNVIRIGTQGAGGGQQNLAFIAGITGSTPVTGNTPQVTVTDNAGNVSVISSGTSGYVLTSNGSATPSFQAAGGGGFGSPCYFSARLSATQTVNAGVTNTLICNDVLVNVGSSYNNSTGVFTAPTTGFYGFTFSSFIIINISGMQTEVYGGFLGSVYNQQTYKISAANTDANEATLLGSIQLPMTTGDTMAVFSQAAGTGTYDVYENGLANTSYFSGYQIA